MADELVICLCGAQAGYPHEKWCPFPCYGHSETKNAEWDRARELAFAKIKAAHEQASSKRPMPSIEQMTKWMYEDAGCEATDGCWVETDGRCEHGKPSWLLAMGLI